MLSIDQDSLINRINENLLKKFTYLLLYGMFLKTCDKIEEAIACLLNHLFLTLQNEIQAWFGKRRIRKIEFGYLKVEFRKSLTVHLTLYVDKISNFISYQNYK